MKSVHIQNVITGNSIKVDIPVTEKRNFFDNLNRRLKEEGLYGIKDQLVISEAINNNARSVISPTNTQNITNIPTPAIPRTNSPLEIPPSTSEELIVSKNKVENPSVSIDGSYIPINDLKNIGPVTPAFPNEIYLQFSTYWKQIGAAAITGDQDYSKSVTFTSGMSKTDSTSISAQLGVNVQGLSASISKTVGHSITINSETTITDMYDIKVSKDKTTVYILWQLVQKYVFVDAKGTTIEWTGHFGTSIPSIGITTKFPNDPRYNESNIVYSDRMNFGLDL